jgi:hypothetical protein
MRMRLLAFTAATMTVAGFMFADVPPASADANAAVCAQTYGKSDGIACNYATHEQCRAASPAVASTIPIFRAVGSPSRPASGAGREPRASAVGLASKNCTAKADLIVTR